MSASGASLNCRLGEGGEDRATQWYSERGYKILDRNWRSGRLGEIDIVASKNGELVIIEVKTRTSDRFGLPAEAITPVKQMRLRKLAASYAIAHPDARVREFRFDVVSILDGTIEVVEDAF